VFFFFFFTLTWFHVSQKKPSGVANIQLETKHDYTDPIEKVSAPN